ncbi:MAG: DUF2800 domain-containing protein [Eubacteriales bacterium]
MSVVPTVERSHAILSASSAHRWLNCQPSARLEETLPESTSDYADEGRLAHEIAELKLRKAFIEPMGARAFNNKLKKLQEDPLYQAEMLGHTDTYLDYITGIAHGYESRPYIAAEKKLDFSEYVPDGFGTGDCIIIGGNTMHIIDFKYGKGVRVSASDNPQMMLYALGAYIEYSFLYQIENIIMTIIQPRLDDGISVFELMDVDLLAWGECVVKPKAKAAFNGEGEYVPGEHCRFCRAKAQCRARCEVNTALEVFKLAKPPLISNEEVGDILKRAQQLAKWVEDLEDYALAECLLGNDIPGWKAVEGKSNREFTNVDGAFDLLKTKGYAEAVLYKRKPITLTETEKLLGKKTFSELLEDYVIKPRGKPALAPITDNRQPITNKITAAEAFGGTTNEGENDNG